MFSVRVCVTVMLLTVGVCSQDRPGDDCLCVPYYQCYNGSINTGGIGVIDIRIQGACENYLDTCCKKGDVVTPPTPIFMSKGCGRRHPEGIGIRITGDVNSEAQFGEFPWMVAVVREDKEAGQTKNVYQCGGAIIHPQVVITAAHCVQNLPPQRLWVLAGEWDTQTKSEPLPTQLRRVGKVVLHENYMEQALYNDVALLMLESELTMADNVDVVCMPKQGQVFDTSKCVATGWGKDVFGKEGRYQVILKKIDLPVVPRPQCLEQLRRTRLGKHFQLHESFMCAGGEPGKDTCQGDGGSPLMCPLANDPTRYQQAGIVAWGIGCGKDIPGVYANVALFRDWVDQHMLYNNYNASLYVY